MRAGAIGTTWRTQSVSSNVEDHSFSNVIGDEMVAMIETIFGTLISKAAVSAVDDSFDEGCKQRLRVSATVCGRSLSAQTVEPLFVSEGFTDGITCILVLII